MKKLMIMSFVLVSGIMNTVVLADCPTLSIYDIQYTEDPNGQSRYDANCVNCTGGIVIHKYKKGRQRVFLYDPNHPDCWGGIQVRADINSPLYDVNLGDWVSLTNVLVSDPAFNETDPYKARGNTILFYDSSSSYTILSTGNELPKPIWVDVNDIAVIYDRDEDICFVTDHRAEKYEAMYLQVRVVTVGDVNVGKDKDNYSLESSEDPNIYCWASDYMNTDNPDGKTPHPIIESGLKLCSVSGVLEQYTKLSDGWDYYQLLTTSTDSFAKTDLDGDCDFDFRDFSVFAQHWLTEEECTAPHWCSGADRTEDGLVNIFDLMEFSKHWLDGKH